MVAVMVPGGMRRCEVLGRRIANLRVAGRGRCSSPTAKGAKGLQGYWPDRCAGLARDPQLACQQHLNLEGYFPLAVDIAAARLRDPGRRPEWGWRRSRPRRAHPVTPTFDPAERHGRLG
jgi:hypothetical protein